MKTKKLIELLQKQDPSGEEEVCVGNVDIMYVSKEPAYHDGPLQVIEGGTARYKRSGVKVQIHTASIIDAICSDPEIVVDYSDLDEDRQVEFKKSHDNLRRWHANLEEGIELEYFQAWLKIKAYALTGDTEDSDSIATEFYKENLSRNDPLEPGPDSYYNRRMAQWDKTLRVHVDDGFLEVEKR